MSSEPLHLEAGADVYCRLCATRAPPPSLRSFARSGVQADSLLASIRRLEPSIYRADGLPQVACLDCMRQLNAVDIFQRSIEAAQVKLTEILMMGTLQEDRFMLKEECTVKGEPEDSDSSNNDSANEDEVSITMSPLKYVVNAKKEIDPPYGESEDRKVSQLFEESALTIEVSIDSAVVAPSDPSQEQKCNKSAPTVALLSSNINREQKTQEAVSPGSSTLRTCSAETLKTVELSRDSTLIAALYPSTEKSKKSALNAEELPLRNNIDRKQYCKTTQDAEPSASSTLPTRVAATTWRTAPTPSLEPGPRFTDYMYCRRCDLRFDSLQPLREHSWSEHARCISFKCIYCTKRILTFKHFYQHYPRHVAALRHCCEFCNERFEFVADVKLHKKLLHAAEKKAHRCVICGMKFPTVEELKNHRDNYAILSSSTKGGRNFKCSLCPKAFPNKIGLVGHMNSHDPTKYVCNICNKSYTSNSILNHHLNTVHKDTKHFICHICGKGFKTKSNYNGHIGVHNGVKQFTCDTCAMTFRNKSQLRAHLVSHTENYSYVCKICDKKYKYHIGLKEHLNSHNEVKPYSCDICQKTFLSWSNFNKHMKRMHDRNMSKKTFNCNKVI